MMKLSLVSASGGADDIVRRLTWLKCAEIVKTEAVSDMTADETGPEDAGDGADDIELPEIPPEP